MRVENFSKSKFKSLQEMYISKKIINIEAKFYIYKEKKTNELKVLKIFYDNSSENMGDKIDVIGSLIQNKDLINMDELILPDYLVSVSSEICGYAMPFVENNVNLKIMLESSGVQLKEKLELLKQVYFILDKIMNNKHMKGNFYLVDIHEANFVLDVDDCKVKAVDMDSCYINGSYYPFSKYFAGNDMMYNYPHKYPVNPRTMNFIPSNNIMFASFIMMLLNTISGEKAYNFSLQQFYDYLTFLEYNGVDKTLIDQIESIYSTSLDVNLDIENLKYLDCSKDYSYKRLLQK